MATKSGTILVKSHMHKVVHGGETIVGIKTIPVRYSTIKADALVEAASRNNSIPVSHIQTACDALANEFYNYILNGHSVKVPQVGTFRLSTVCKAAENIDDDIELKRTRIILTPARELRDLLDRVTLSRYETIEEQLGEDKAD